jgi:hypothetical protein
MLIPALALLFSLTVWLGSTPAMSQPPGAVPEEISGSFRNPTLQGSGSLDVLWSKTLDAALWTDGSPTPEKLREHPLALSFMYHQPTTRDELTEEFLEAMRQQQRLEPETEKSWRRFISTTLPNLDKGDRLVAMAFPDGRGRFYHNGQWLGEIHDMAFTQQFFDIWLAPHTQNPALRRQLMGTPE